MNARKFAGKEINAEASTDEAASVRVEFDVQDLIDSASPENGGKMPASNRSHRDGHARKKFHK